MVKRVFALIYLLKVAVLAHPLRHIDFLYRICINTTHTFVRLALVSIFRGARERSISGLVEQCGAQGGR